MPRCVPRASCGGPEEIVTPDTGLLTECDDEAALVQAMTTMIGREFRADVLRSHIRERYGYADIAARLCGVYGSVAAERKEVA